MPLVSKAFGDIITFTRSSTVATFTGSNGLIQSATTNTPRFDYDPVTLAAKGLLIEEQRTNLLTYSEDFSNAIWVKTTDGGVTVSSNVLTAPDGTSNADKVIPNAVNGFHCVQQIYTFTNVSHSFSFFAKAGEYTNVQVFDSLTSDFVNFNLSTGAVGSSLAYTGSIQSFGNGWYRCVAVKTFAASTANIRIGVIQSSTAIRGENFTGNGTDGLYIWGAQLEAGAFATSYIPTVASQVTRSADVASVNTLSPWFNASGGSIYAEGDITGSPASNRLYEFHDGTDNNRLLTYTVNSASSVRFAGNSSGSLTEVANLSFTPASGVPFKSVGAYTSGEYAICVNGGVIATAAPAALPIGLTTVVLGARRTGSNALNGHIRRITYYPRKLSSAELQAITA